MERAAFWVPSNPQDSQHEPAGDGVGTPNYMNLLDEPVPMLGNTTPRRAAKSAKGREKLVTWLKLLENGAARHEGGSPVADCDLTWMWEEFGVANLRR